MEKFLDILKGLFEGFVELLLHPVSKVIDTVQRENIKRGAIKGAIIAFVLSIVSVLSTIRVIHIVYNDYNRDKEQYIEAFNPILSLLRTFVIYVLVILVVALVLFAISKLIKDQKSLPYTLSMTVNSATVLTVGAVLGLILSFWTPLSVLVISITTLHSVLTLLVSFMSSLTNINTDKLILVSLAVITIVGIGLAVIDMIKYKTTLSNYADGKFSNKTQFGDVQHFKSRKDAKEAQKKAIKDGIENTMDVVNTYSEIFGN